MSTDLFDPCVVSGLRLQNRIVMSPLTRCRADMDGHVGALQATYYRQRATAGLIITEATAVVPEGRGGPGIPGLWDDAHVESWRGVTEAVHAQGGRIFCQLWHAGRISHSSLHPRGLPPVNASPMRQPGQVVSVNGPVDYEPSRELTLEEIPVVIAAFRTAALRAQAAGFDGVEVHGAHSYLLDSFTRSMTNHRSDAYGGSMINRARMLLDTVAAVAEVWGGHRTAVRLAPIGQAYGAWDSHPEPLFTYIIDRLNDLGVGFLDMVEGDTGVSREVSPSFDLQILRRRFAGTVIANNLYNRALALEARREDRADLIAFGRDFIGNPDLVARLRDNAPLTQAGREAYYTGGPKGYVDFEPLETVAP